MATISDNLQHVHARIQQACGRSGRSVDAVELLAVSKTFPIDEVREAYQAGQRAFGENYVQEAVDKILAAQALGMTDAQWHCIGPLQSNKTRLVAAHFDWVHTVERLKIAERLSDQRPDGLPELSVCIQVNVDGGPNKAGVAPGELLALAQAVAVLPRLRLRGVMCIPEPTMDFASAVTVFSQARELFEKLKQAGLAVDTLSMGMSDDLEAAIAAGSSMVRVGSAIFGRRPSRLSEPAG